MPYSVTKNPDGDVSLGSVNGEFVTLTPSTSDYALGGYALIDGVAVVDNPSLSQNIDLYRLLVAVPAGGPAGLTPSYNPATKKVQFFEAGVGTAPGIEFTAGINIAPFQLLLIGL